MSVVHRLQREIKASPAKAGGLGVLVLVALYFWFPLLMGSSEAEPPAAAPAPEAAPIATGHGMPTAPALKPAAAPQTLDYQWQQFAKLMDEDVLTRTVQELPRSRDPFQRVGAALETQELATADTAEAIVEAPAIPARTPQQAGLVLSSTLIGNRSQVAQINGKSYRVGDEVPPKLGDSEDRFQVIAVLPRRVVLEDRDGKRHLLRIPRPLLDDANETEEFKTSASSPSDAAPVDRNPNVPANGKPPTGVQ